MVNSAVKKVCVKLTGKYLWDEDMPPSFFNPLAFV